MLIYNKTENYSYNFEDRLVYNEVPGGRAESASEKPMLPQNTIIKMAQLKARKSLYKDWGNVVMLKLGKQETNLKKYLKLDPSKITKPEVAYRQLKKLNSKMEKEWKKEQRKKVAESGGVIDLGTFTYPVYLDTAPCKPLNKKEQAFLSTNGARMPKSQIADYQNLAMELQMELAMNGERAFREKAKSAGIDMSKADANRAYEFSQEQARNLR